ncbi:MAG: ABC transporter ATP-binding protein [TACK group archaeon]|nr:ABC transporter ATP-binding protein [TACK group archaeon]
MPSVKLQNIWKSFGKTQVLKGINLEVNDGEFMVLLGPSGSGKTTALRTVAGLEEQDAGHVWIGDKLVDDLAPRERNIAMVFQNYALYPHKTVRENIEMPLRAQKISKDVMDESVADVAKRLEISDLLDRYPRQLSGGQQQRVALARALVRRPSAFLLDEPLSNLDAKLRVSARTFLKSLQKEMKITTIYVTHDQAEAMAMADRIALISEGTIQQVGEPERVYFYPDSVFVAGFLGSPSINFFDGRLEGHRLTFLGHEFSLKDELDVSGEVTVGIRPEDVSLSSSNDGLQAKVLVVEPLGHEFILTLKIGSWVFKSRIFGRESPAPGENVKVTWDQHAIMVFHQGKRVWPRLEVKHLRTRSTFHGPKPKPLDYVALQHR